ncbi:MAG TPA: YsnF/AvaK domain-containing protein [Falsiroseomonas sp.]|jgi:uncharacterized protein (TIGR02271 family)|nr:YsnF/AvaK domain-containing protein [Falsiroseomonas sp.]
MRTITAFYDTPADGRRARDALIGLGFPAGRVRLHEADRGSGTAATGRPEEDRGLFASIADLFMPHEDRTTYAEGLRRGGTMVSAEVEDHQVDAAADALEAAGAVDLDTREAEWRREGWAGAAAGGAAKPRTGAKGKEEVIPVVEEQLRVGKRETREGRVRVRSYVVETPVEEQVRLREEHVNVQRRPADRAVTGEAPFQDRVVEATESSEEAVVQKEARVTEEVVVNKDATERTETVRDKVRRTEVDVDRDAANDSVKGGGRGVA